MLPSDGGPRFPDAGSVLPDAGPTRPDSGPVLADAGAILGDSGSPPRDAGSPPVDSGSIASLLWSQNFESSSIPSAWGPESSTYGGLQVFYTGYGHRERRR